MAQAVAPMTNVQLFAQRQMTAAKHCLRQNILVEVFFKGKQIRGPHLVFCGILPPNVTCLERVA
jgi:hypothetical protein